MEFLSGIPLFDGLPLSDLKALKAISTGKKYNKDEIIFSEGDPGGLRQKARLHPVRHGRFGRHHAEQQKPFVSG
jgi:signal-transduction protein with cAMP-binding, CBS, and nucleotidyltransferase domain